jgi:hypothetical protein
VWPLGILSVLAAVVLAVELIDTGAPAEAPFQDARGEAGGPLLAL